MKCIILYTIFVAILFDFPVNCDDVIRKTLYGYVRGSRTEKSLEFLGIPYATPPVQQLRWKPPQRARPWAPNIYNATKIAPACPQKYCDAYLPPSSCPTLTSEDCLYLYIWTPLDADNSTRYPVMVFIHGGAFKTGFAASSIYDGSKMANEGNVVVVNNDYRLGVLGFLYTGDSDREANGNFGIQDQRLALQWVQDNIHNFGGDPSLVTLFGQSAGAQSVVIHMTSFLSAGLFHQAIIQSSPLSLPYRTKQTALDLSRVISRLLRCPDYDMKCLRSRSADEIGEAQQKSTLKFSTLTLLDYFEPLGPIIDGNDIKRQPMDAASRNETRRMPTMIGTVTQECVWFVYLGWKLNLTRPEYDAALAVFHPSEFKALETEYPPTTNSTDLRPELAQFCTDFLFTCSTRNVSRDLLKSGIQNLYRYIFDHAAVNHGGWGNLTFCEDHVCHAEELPFLFGNMRGSEAPTADEQLLHDSMVTYWTNFAYTGDPNKGPRVANVAWPLYDESVPATLHFITPVNDYDYKYRDDYCNFWDKIGFNG